MAQTTDVYTNSTWLDYDCRGIWRRQVTLSDGPSWVEGSPWITAVAAVLIAFASPAAYMLLTRLLVWFTSWIWNRFFKGENDNTPLEDSEGSAAVDADETTALDSTGNVVPAGFIPYSRVGEIMWSSRTPDSAIWDLGKLVREVIMAKNINRSRSAYIWKESILAAVLILLTLASLGIFVCFAIGGIVSGGIVSDSVVLSDSAMCGVWVLDEEMKGYILPNFPQHYYFQELEASEYSKHCYGAPKGTDGCNFFVVPEFQVYQNDHTPCPFSEDLCLGGPLPHSHCLRTLSISSLQNDWIPIEEFNTTANREITLLFIQSQNIYYSEKRHDPIFPAESLTISPADGVPLYYNADHRANVLACVDRKDICHASGAPCFSDIYDPNPESPEHLERVGYYMLLLGLRRSSIGNAVQLRGGSALDANSKVVGNCSVPLATDQWKVEVRAAFEASLARIQITLRDLVRGAAASEKGFRNHIDSGMQDMCHMYKFRGIGWKRASVLGLCLLGLSAVVVYILGIEIDIEPDETDETGDGAEQEGVNDNPTSRGYGAMQASLDPSSPRSPNSRPVKRTRLVAVLIVYGIWNFLRISSGHIHKIVILRNLKEGGMRIDERLEQQDNVAERPSSTSNGVLPAGEIETTNGS